MNAALIVFIVVAFLVVVVVAMSVRIVRPYQRGLVERLGKFHATVDPGLRLIFPFIATRLHRAAPTEMASNIHEP